MGPTKDLAIILRSVAFEDRHRIVTALTERHGQISGLARNSIQSRRFGGTLEPFTASEWLFVEKPGAELVQLNEAIIRRSFEGIRKDFERLSLASVFSEFMLRIAPKNENCVDLFKLHSNALAALEEMPEGEASERTILLLLNGYLAKALQWSGNQPRLQACQSCKRSLDTLSPTDSITCLISDAAWLCPNCRSSQTRGLKRRKFERHRWR
jgi:DNA repair protein RecO